MFSHTSFNCARMPSASNLKRGSVWTSTVCVSVLPFTVTASGTSLNAPFNTQVADQTKPEVAILGGIGQGSPYFDTTAYAAVTAARLGNSGRNSLKGPTYKDVDLALMKDFGIYESLHLQFRAEFFNLFNHTNFENPVTVTSSANFGQIISANPSREIQGALKLIW